MKTKEISAQEYNDLPRSAKRELKRNLKKEGKTMPEIRERLQLVATVDKELYLKGVQVLEQNRISINRFIDLAFTNLILTNKK